MRTKDPLLDKDFLKALDQENQREIYAKIASLTFEENPIEFITGQVTGGSISIDGKSSTRRTCQIQLVAKELNIHEYYWGLNTKMMVFIGLKNTINPEYPDIIWFPQGLFLITQFTTNQTTNNYNISVSGRDKMSLLNGDIGGVIYSLSADFGKIEETDADGIVTVSSIPLKDIIREAVHEYAREPFENIIINDLDDIGLELMEYRGTDPMYFLVDDKTNEVTNMFLDTTGKEYRVSIDGGKTYSQNKEDLNWENFVFNTRADFFDNAATPTHIMDGNGNTYTVIKCTYGEAIGYRETDLTYAGDLIGSVGNSLTNSCLDPIKKMLGNFEYFYDIDGRFHFQKKPTFVDISWNNLVKDEDSQEIYANSAALTTPFLYSFENANLITAFQNKPKLDQIKNDYSIWGTRLTTGGKEYPVHLRYAIDRKPEYYKTFDGRIYSSMIKTKSEIYKIAEMDDTVTMASIIANYQKAPLPYGLSNMWWSMSDWASLYKELTGEYPNGFLDDYTQGEYDHLDLETLFPGGIKYINWQTRDLQIFDVKITEDGDLNGPLYSVVHNPHCTHRYTSYFLNYAQDQGFVSYIYNPKFPSSINDEQIRLIQLQKIVGKQHWGCDWREILYQMAKDYLKYEHNPDFLATLAKNNPDYYPSGYTGYEMYYTDIVSFWREIYNPEYEWTLTPAYVTKSLYENNLEEYYWYEQQGEENAFDPNATYYIKNSYNNYEKYSVAQDEFYLDQQKYYILQNNFDPKAIPYKNNRDYFTISYNDYCQQKYLANVVEKYSDLTAMRNPNPGLVYYTSSTKKYYYYNGSNFNLLSEPDDRLVHNPEFGWSQEILNNPSGTNFWFDFLDSLDGSLVSYNVRNIGDRPKSINDADVKAIYYRDTPEVIFLDSGISSEEKLTQKKLKPGYTFILLPAYMFPLFNLSTQKKCTKDVLEEWLYDYAHCAESISITSLPIYYLEPNTRIFVHDENSGINGEYIIDKINYQLTYNATMQIQATKAIDRIY